MQTKHSLITDSNFPFYKKRVWQLWNLAILFKIGQISITAQCKCKYFYKIYNYRNS